MAENEILHHPSGSLTPATDTTSIPLEQVHSHVLLNGLSSGTGNGEGAHTRLVRYRYLGKELMVIGFFIMIVFGTTQEMFLANTAGKVITEKALFLLMDGYWCGAIMAVAGAFSIAARRRGCKAWVPIVARGLGIFAMFTAFIQLCICVVALVGIEKRPDEEEDKPEVKTGRYSPYGGGVFLSRIVILLLDVLAMATGIMNLDLHISLKQ